MERYSDKTRVLGLLKMKFYPNFGMAKEVIEMWRLLLMELICLNV